MMKFLDPKHDLVFKKIFGNEKKQEILISFLNNILGRSGPHTIESVTLLNTVQHPEIPGDKESILDVRCHDQDGREYIVEMQIVQKKGFAKRVQYYVSKSYSRQLNQSEDYFRLNPVIFLGILDFNFTDKPHYLSYHRTHETDTGERLFVDLEYALVELPKFQKTHQELQTVTDKWLFFLKHAPELESVPEEIYEEAIKEAFEIVEKASWSKDELFAYEQKVNVQRDRSAEIGFGFDQGIEIGEERGIIKGREEGREEGIEIGEERGIIKGREEGREEGRSEERASLAKKMLSDGADLSLISKYTGFSKDDLLKMKMDVVR